MFEHWHSNIGSPSSNSLCLRIGTIIRSHVIPPFWNAQIRVTCHVSILTYPECCNYVLFEKVKKFIFVVEPVFDCDASLMFSVN